MAPLRRAALAQLVEHIIRNDGVTGSSPVSGTISLIAECAGAHSALVTDRLTRTVFLSQCRHRNGSHLFVIGQRRMTLHQKIKVAIDRDIMSRRADGRRIRFFDDRRPRNAITAP